MIRPKPSARRSAKEAELNAINNGISVTPAAVQDGHKLVVDAVAEFLEETKLTKKPKTLAAYTKDLSYFTESCSKRCVEEIERKDMLKFAAFLWDEKELEPRTCWNKFSNVMSFLKAQGVRGMVKGPAGKVLPAGMLVEIQILSKTTMAG